MQKGSNEIPGHLSAGRRFVERLDGNGGGKISRSEFDGPINRFDYQDKNHGEYLTENEAPEDLPSGGNRPFGP
jgi:hypothetical protein